MTPRDIQDGRRLWDGMAESGPFYAVCSAQGLEGRVPDVERLRAFWASGRHDLAAVLRMLRRCGAGREVFASALDFGCGVGRLTLPLAQRCDRLDAVDISPNMLEHARQNLAAADIHHVTFGTAPVTCTETPEYTFILSHMVFQHIPVSHGLDQLRALLSHLRPGGFAALHFAHAVATPSWPARMVSEHAPVLMRLAHSLRLTRRRVSFPMYAYPEPALEREARAGACTIVERLATRHDSTRGAIVVFRKDVAGAST